MIMLFFEGVQCLNILSERFLLSILGVVNRMYGFGVFIFECLNGIIVLIKIICKKIKNVFYDI